MKDMVAPEASFTASAISESLPAIPESLPVPPEFHRQCNLSQLEVRCRVYNAVHVYNAVQSEIR